MRTLGAILLLCSACLAQGVGTVGFNATAFSSGSASGTVFYYGAGCNGTLTQTCSANAAATAWSMVPNPIGLNITTGSNAAGYTATNCGVRMTAKDATNQNYRCAVYLASTNALVANCAQTSNQTIGTVPNWQESPLPAGCALAANTSYRVMIEVNGAGTYFSYNSQVGEGYYAAQTFGNWTTPLAVTLDNKRYAVYVKTTAN